MTTHEDHECWYPTDDSPVENLNGLERLMLSNRYLEVIPALGKVFVVFSSMVSREELPFLRGVLAAAVNEGPGDVVGSEKAFCEQAMMLELLEGILDWASIAEQTALDNEVSNLLSDLGLNNE